MKNSIILGTMLILAVIISVLAVNLHKGTLATSLLDNCYDKEQFKGNARIEQMFVIANNEGLVSLEDTHGNVWTYYAIDLYEDDEVLVLITDNGTRTLKDDQIVHFWLGLE